MIVKRYNTKKEHIKSIVAIQSVLKYGFNARELALAVEYLTFAYVYSKKPLVVEETLPNGTTETHKFTGVLSMVSHPRTLKRIRENLDMSQTIIRKHTKGLKLKKFFTNDKDGKGTFNKDFEDAMSDSVMFNSVFVL